MAAPLAAGIAAMYLQLVPQASSEQVRSALISKSAGVLTNLSGSPNRLLQSSFLAAQSARVGLSQAGISAAPSSVAGVALSVKVFNPSERSLIAVFPCDQPASVSSADLPAGSIGQATVISAVSASGEICIQARNGAGNPIAADRMIVYATGWFAAGSGTTTYAPIRAADRS
jgi:hypothetical protein